MAKYPDEYSSPVQRGTPRVCGASRSLWEVGKLRPVNEKVHLTVEFGGSYLRVLLSLWHPSFGAHFAPPLLTSKALLCFNPSNDSCSFLREKKRNLDVLFHQRPVSPLRERKTLDLDLGIHLLTLSLFFLPSPSIAFVTLVSSCLWGVFAIAFCALV